MRTKKFQMLKLDLEKAEELEIKLPTPKLLFDNQIAFWIIKKTRDFQKSVYFCFIDYAKAFDYMDHKKLENSSSDRINRPPYLPLEKSICRSRSNS